MTSLSFSIEKDAVKQFLECRRLFFSCRIVVSGHPPQTPHAFHSLEVQGRPLRVLRKCWQLELWRTLEDVFSQYWPPAAGAEVDERLVDVLPLRWRERKSHGGKGLASAQRPEPPDFASDSSRAWKQHIRCRQNQEVRGHQGGGAEALT